MLGSLNDKVILITGAAQGIGAAFADGLANCGSKVMICDKLDGQSLVDNIVKQGGEALFFNMDVTNEEQVGITVKEIISRYNRIDVLVNNAAIWGDIEQKNWEKITIDEWELVLRVNIIGTFIVSRTVVPFMKNRGQGKIINIGSSSFFIVPPFILHYMTSKSAVVGLTRCMARELGDHNITVNTLSPGLTASDATKRQHSENEIEEYATMRCLKRVETPKDLVGTLLYLCSNGSDFITGQNILVDGGTGFN
jgi:NAD(P)-dependent dehydrogenase (short-subunit alcohol dehydrogenase family)